MPKVKKQNSIEVYLNSKIQKLQKYKSYILSQLHRASTSVNQHECVALKELIKDISSEIKNEYSKSMNRYWENKIRNIPAHNSKALFPQVNRIFRKKNLAQISTVKIPQNNTHLTDEAGIDPTTLPTEGPDKFIISDAKHKLETLGAYFMSINNSNKNLGRPQLNKIIKRDTNSLKEEMLTDSRYNNTVSFFTSSNRAEDPSDIEEDLGYFTNTFAVTKKFKKLNNKKSAGPDEIPNIALKHIPPKILLVLHNPFQQSTQ